jgi:hypothetical protein
MNAQQKAASPGRGEAAQHNKFSPKNNDALPKTQVSETDPLVGWFSLGRNVKPRRTWKGGRK